jgi:hypothetical protein
VKGIVLGFLVFINTLIACEPSSGPFSFNQKGAFMFEQFKGIQSPLVTDKEFTSICKQKRSKHGLAVIYCRTYKSARELYQKYFGHPYNPNNQKKGIVFKEGYLAIITYSLNVKEFWTSHGYYPVLSFNRFYGKSKYNRWISNAVKFIHDCNS